MNILSSFFRKLGPEMLLRTYEHVYLTFLAILVAVVIALPLGIYLTRCRWPKLTTAILGVAGIIQTVPSLALIAFIVLVFALVALPTVGPLPAIVALVLYALLPIMRNTYTGIRQVDPAIIEVATGMGMKPHQVLFSVELPLSLPVIMAGIRISTVWTIGIATLCGLIGAGGLGDLIWRGLRTIPRGMDLLVAGTIPAAILALLSDWTLGRLEKWLTPKRTLFLIPVCAIVAMTLCMPRILERPMKSDTITIGSKHFTEQEILGELMAIMIESNSNINVARKLNLGGTMICFNALKAGDLDLYAEYTGTGLVNILEQEAISDPHEAYETVKREFRERYDLRWLEPFGFNNTYTLTMRRDQAEELGIDTISDLVKVLAGGTRELRAGFDAEFLARPDGYDGLAERYGFRFPSRPMQMDPGLMYRAIADGAVDVIDGFATDGRIPAFDLVVLEDDRGFFPPYYAAPLVRDETLKRHPEIEEILNRLAGKISNESMQKLNYEVDEKGRLARDVAREFLVSQGLISEDVKPGDR